MTHSLFSIKLTKILFFILFLLGSGSLKAQEVLKLTLPANWALTSCPSPVWNQSPIFFEGVVDKRSDPYIGIQQIKGEAVAFFVSQPPLADMMTPALKQLFSTCGLLLTKTPDENTPRWQVEINQFLVGADKKFLTGKGEALSRLSILIKHSHQTTQIVEIGFSIENKGLRKSKTKQLEKTANELLFETLKQIPLARALKEATFSPGDR